MNSLLKKYLSLTILSLALLSSCIKEESETNVYSSDEEIFYNVAPIVKADSYSEYSTDVPFVSYAWRLTEGKSWDTDRAEDADEYIKDEVVSYDSDKKKWTTAKAHLWPIGGSSVSFLSYSPAYLTRTHTLRTNTGSEGSFTVDDDISQVSGQLRLRENLPTTTEDVPATFTVSKDGISVTGWNVEEENYRYLDFVVADVAKDCTAKNSGNGVSTIFRHPFAQVGVMFANNSIEEQKTDTGTSLVITRYFLVSKIVITSVYTEGSFAYNGSQWDWSDLGPIRPWTESAGTYKNGGVKEFVLYDASVDTEDERYFPTTTITATNDSGEKTNISGIEVNSSGFTQAGWYRPVPPQVLEGGKFTTTTTTNSSGETTPTTTTIGERAVPEIQITYYQADVTTGDDGSKTATYSTTAQTAKRTLNTITGNNANSSTNTSHYWEVGKRTTYYITFGKSTIPIVFDVGDIDGYTDWGGQI